MGKKPYTVLIISQKAELVKKFILSPLTLKFAAVLFGLGVVISGYILYDYVTYKNKLSELHALRNETQAQRVEIQSFIEKISALEEQLAKLKEIERQMEKDLRDIQELKKTKKGPQPSAPKKNISFSIKESMAASNPGALKDGISLQDYERPRVVRLLHQDLSELRGQALARQQTFREIQTILRAQKSILMATPSLWPVMGPITSKFGDTRISDSSGGTRPHNGVDIAAPVGTPVRASADGVVILAERESYYGLLVGLDHGHGFTSWYGHLKDIKVKVGERVKKGWVIGTVGTTGKTTGPHLHYEVRIHNQPVNPAHYLSESS